MINTIKLKHVLNDYKKDFPKLFWTDRKNNEKYKWIAVKTFQDNWNIDATDFLKMFIKATSKTENLLSSINYYPLGMMIDFCKADPEKVRKMFQDLYDESKSVVTRIENFIKESEHMRVKYQPKSGWNSHYQNPNSITTYLWLRYPDKYYIYKYTECKTVASELDTSYTPTKGAKPETLLGAIKLYDEIAEYLSTDSELIALVNKHLDDTCYYDPKFRTLAIDVGFYISRYYSKKDKNNTNKIDHAWYVGAVIDDVDMLETFVAESRWENGYKNKHLDEVKSMKPGDRIAIKSAYTRKNVPFKTNGASVSVMGIKAIGTIISNPGDGRNVKVKWDKVFDPVKEWFFFTMRNVLWHVERQEDEWMYGALLDFTFANAEQEYDKFLEIPFWKDRYVDDTPPEEEPDVEVFDFVYEDAGFLPEQIIYYGAPGTGKSYEVNNKLKARYEDENERDFHSARVIFHPDYTYGDFVGSIRPIKPEGQTLTYDFVAGPFTELLKKSFLNPTEKFYLILEEINRGNAAAIFGDLFQLLDRDEKTGISSYRINNSDIAGFLRKDNRLNSLFIKEKIWLPSNFNIICTMNTADQNVFVLDSAFKRRFAEEYTEIDFTKLTDDLKNTTTVFEGTTDLKNLFSNTTLSNFVNQLDENGEIKRDWSTFAKIVNYIIDDINEESGSEQISEDKKLGPFFVTPKDLECRKNFINKVLHYLKQDVFKYVDFYFAESYQTIYTKYLNDSADVFTLLKRQGE